MQRTVVAFSSDVPRGGEDDTQIWVMNADGTDVHPVSRGEIDIQPAWSPTENRIMFVRGFQFIETSPDRIDEERLSASGMSPAWSPDGRWIAAVQLRDRQSAFGPYPFGLYAFHPDGSSAHLILKLRGPVFSPPAWRPKGGS